VHVVYLYQGKGKLGDPSLPMLNLIRKEITLICVYLSTFTGLFSALLSVCTVF